MTDPTLIPERTPTDDELRRELEQLVLNRGTGDRDEPGSDAQLAARGRARVQRWCAGRVALEDGRRVSPALVRVLLADIVQRLELELGAERAAGARLDVARAVLERELLGD